MTGSRWHTYSHTAQSERRPNPCDVTEVGAPVVSQLLICPAHDKRHAPIVLLQLWGPFLYNPRAPCVMTLTQTAPASPSTFLFDTYPKAPGIIISFTITWKALFACRAPKVNLTKNPTNQANTLWPHDHCIICYVIDYDCLVPLTITCHAILPILQTTPWLCHTNIQTGLRLSCF